MTTNPWQHLVIPPEPTCLHCEQGTEGHHECPWKLPYTPERSFSPRDPECMALALQGADARAWVEAGNRLRVVTAP